MSEEESKVPTAPADAAPETPTPSGSGIEKAEVAPLGDAKGAEAAGVAEDAATKPDEEGAKPDALGRDPKPDDPTARGSSTEEASADGTRPEAAHANGTNGAHSLTPDVIPTATGWGLEGLDDGGALSPTSPLSEEPPLLERGNPLRILRGGVTAAVGTLVAFLIMAKAGQWRLGVPLGTLAVLVATFGVLDLLGSFDDPEDRVAGGVDLAELGRPLGATLAAGGAFIFTLMVAAGGAGSQWIWGLAVTAAFLLFVGAVYRVGASLGPWSEAGKTPPIWRRHGFWLVAVAALLYFPAMGIYSLWDPWETHYGEVAREILARDDWISLWWAQDGWFWSKPILNFWIQAIAMASLGVHYKPDAMLLGAGGRYIGHPEWIVRAPNVLMTIVAMYILYKGVSRVFGKRAGLLGGIVLATMPDWYFLAHQTMTDMPFVSAMTAAMGLLLLGLHTEEHEKARVYEVKAFGGSLRVSAWHLVFGATLLCVIPQIVYLFSRNVGFVTSGGFGFSPHYDIFRSGSPGNCGDMHANEACADHFPASIPKGFANTPEGLALNIKRFLLSFEPALQALLWAGLTGFLLFLNWGERRTRRLCYLAAWLCAAIATMGKGPAGFILPMVCAFAYVCTKKKWSELLRLEIVSGLTILLVVAVPWYVAMYVRHGPPFTDRLIFHDMINRTFSHVHDTNEGDDTSFRFYMWQLGYAIFPWTGLAPVGLLWWTRRGDSSDSGRGDASIFLVMWFLFGFALFSFMGTKFHHYIFPVVPAVAMLVGVVLDDVLRASARGILPVRFLLAETGGGAAGSSEPGEEAPASQHESLLLGAAAVASAIIIGVVARDLVGKPEGADQPGAIRLLHLFTYNYRRPWPDSLDFAKPLAIFGGLFALVSLVFVVKKLRAAAVIAFSGCALVWALWGLDVYMVKTAPHWGQRELVEAYYQNRGENEPLVAYQMNWKGENFYTGNHVPAYVSSGSDFTNWVKLEREKGVKVMYFITEHGRVGGLKSEAGAKSWKEMTTKEICNKFILMRAEL